MCTDVLHYGILTLFWTYQSLRDLEGVGAETSTSSTARGGAPACVDEPGIGRETAGTVLPARHGGCREVFLSVRKTRGRISVGGARRSTDRVVRLSVGRLLVGRLVVRFPIPSGVRDISRIAEPGHLRRRRRGLDLSAPVRLLPSRRAGLADEPP
jgi:hypothetical protein